MTEAEIEIILEGAKEKHPDRSRDHLRQRPQFIGQGLQGYSDFGHDARENLTHYPNPTGKIERGINRSKRIAFGGYAADAGRRAATHPGVCRPLTPCDCTAHRLRHARRHAGGAPGGDPAPRGIAKLEEARQRAKDAGSDGRSQARYK